MRVFKTLLLSNVYILLYKRTIKIARLTRIYERFNTIKVSEDINLQLKISRS